MGGYLGDRSLEPKASWELIERCNREMTTYVWGNQQNPDTWRCVRPKGHKGAHRRYDP